MPNKQGVEVAAVYGESEEEMNIAQCGDQVRLRLRGIEEEEVLPGFVLCSPKRLIHNVKQFDCQIRILELKSILSAGFDCVLHVHSAIEEVTFAALLHKLQKGTNRKSKLPPSHAKKGDSIIARLEVTGGAGSVCVEAYDDAPQLGRFTLRDQGQTIAIGKSKPAFHACFPPAHPTQGGGWWTVANLPSQSSNSSWTIMLKAILTRHSPGRVYSTLAGCIPGQTLSRGEPAPSWRAVEETGERHRIDVYRALVLGKRQTTITDRPSPHVPEAKVFLYTFRWPLFVVLRRQ